MIVSAVMFAGKPTAIVCDGKCEKAWGRTSRPIRAATGFCVTTGYCTDAELGDAPKDPGTYEGGFGKPTDRIHNKWCARECERAELVRECEVLSLPTFGEDA